jgi:hypothetical protein
MNRMEWWTLEARDNRLGQASSAKVSKPAPERVTASWSPACNNLVTTERPYVSVYLASQVG